MFFLPVNFCVYIIAETLHYRYFNSARAMEAVSFVAPGNDIGN
jgi:hypothetical protein